MCARERYEYVLQVSWAESMKADGKYWLLHVCSSSVQFSFQSGEQSTSSLCRLTSAFPWNTYGGHLTKRKTSDLLELTPSSVIWSLVLNNQLWRLLSPQTSDRNSCCKFDWTPGGRKKQETSSSGNNKNIQGMKLRSFYSLGSWYNLKMPKRNAQKNPGTKKARNQRASWYVPFPL